MLAISPAKNHDHVDELIYFLSHPFHEKSSVYSPHPHIIAFSMHQFLINP